MNNLKVLKFKSVRGNEYLYDDATSLIIPWGAMEEEILKELMKGNNPLYTLIEKFNKRELELKCNYIEFLKNIGAFWGTTLNRRRMEQSEVLQIISENAANQLILSVTDDCNLRCKYCYYSEEYHLTKNKSMQYMSKETAKQAIDYYYQLVKKQLMKNPRRKIGITFYGGEPLMNMPIIEFAVAYSNQLFCGNATYMLTTNGILLNDENVKFFVENQVRLAISIDGPQREHDRLRIHKDGMGSYERIFQNIRRIREGYPEYFKEMVNTVCVFDPKTDVLIVEKFYEEMERKYQIPRAIFVNQVLNTETDYYNQFTEEDMISFDKNMKELKKKYFNKKIENREISSYLRGITGQAISIVTLRRRIDDKATFCLKTSGACLPGNKLAVDATGNINICERVSGKNCIGDVKSGLDEKAIMRIVEEYNAKSLKNCQECPITRLCGLCYMHFENENGFKEDKTQCLHHREVIRQRLIEYVSICEESPNTDF